MIRTISEYKQLATQLATQQMMDTINTLMDPSIPRSIKLEPDTLQYVRLMLELKAQRINREAAHRS